VKARDRAVGQPNVCDLVRSDRHAVARRQCFEAAIGPVLGGKRELAHAHAVSLGLAQRLGRDDPRIGHRLDYGVSREEIEEGLAAEFDREALAVYADLLQAEGDPRGERTTAGAKRDASAAIRCS
jgi:hypothetical protein